MKRFAFATVLSFAALLALRPADAAERNLTVVELFTSQGCSSCPPAEAYLGELSRRDDLLALEQHVDYWDYIGWKDPFASPANTDRQRRYNRRLERGYVYTPQMVVDGIAEAIGSERSAVQRAIQKAQDPARKPVKIKLKTTDEGMIIVKLPEIDMRVLCDVILVGFDRQHMTRVLRGENGGRTLTNYNVVREMQRVGFWSGQSAVIELPKLDGDARRGWAVIVQEENGGPIRGAARISSETLTIAR